MVIDYDELGQLAHYETVYTTGTFDLIHIGHVKFLESIKQLCPNAKLVVGVSPDKRVKYKKGKCRPVLSQAERLGMVDCVKYVDYAFIYPTKNSGKDNPVWEVIDKLQPTYFISKPIYQYHDAVELQKRGVKQIVVPDNNIQSTTKIISKILAGHKETSSPTLLRLGD